MKSRYRILLSAFLAAILLLGFVMPLNPPNGNWYQQFMPNIGNRQISDIFFLDSLTGWAVTPYVTQNDSVFVLKTTNSGDNWFKVYSAGGQFVGMNRIKFLDQNTGYSCGVGLFNGSTGINKTTNGGVNWFSVNEPVSPSAYNDMSILDINSIWLVMNESLTGGVFYTSNGGTSWQQQSAPPSDKIYMYNSRLGFISKATGTPAIYKTTNSGQNWNVLLSSQSFYDMKFADSLTGWYSYGSNAYKTTNGGNNWITQVLPYGGSIIISNINRFSVLSGDTVWGAGGQLFYGGGRFRAMLYRTTNGGNNWLFQIPDTSFGIPALGYIQFLNKNLGWSYNTRSGIHTTNGGDPVWLTGIQQISAQLPKEYKLFQNYPNPFNPTTIINYELKITNYVKIIVYDILGKEVTKLVNQKQNPGAYQVDFSGINYSSGVYFYTLFIDNKIVDTKKMVLLR